MSLRQPREKPKQRRRLATALSWNCLRRRSCAFPSRRQVRTCLLYTSQQEPGSLADSMIQVNGVMEAAQNAAKQYLEHMREMEIAKQKEAEAVITAARYQAEQIISKAKAGAEQVKEASTNVLQSLQIEIDKMLSGARGEYEQRIAADTPVPGAEAYINMALQQKPFEQDTQAETGEVPHLDDILYPAADSRQQEEAVQPVGIQGEKPFAEITLQEEKTQTDFPEMCIRDRAYAGPRPSVFRSCPPSEYPEK